MSLFSSESVSPGHPDKVADQIADAFLDTVLTQDPNARVACECMVTTGMVLVGGEVSTHTWVDVDSIVRKKLHEIGYENHIYGFSADHVAVITTINKQSADIAQGVTHSNPQLQGAGDQGIMFGFACNESPNFMPLPITLAHELMQAQTKAFKLKQLPWLGPDAKAQVSIVYDGHTPISIHNVVLSTQHLDQVSPKEIKEGVIDTIILPNLPKDMITANTSFHINPTGRFVLGGPAADCGLTGRKIIVDTYGGYARHGGGAFSGKDPSKVDRSAAYMARHIAKNIVAAGLAEKCELQLAYAIGVAKPTSIRIETFGTSKCSEQALVSLVDEYFDLTPHGIIQYLALKSPIYQQIAAFGHFGREDLNLAWEQTQHAQTFKSLILPKP
ncbi:MAG: methionine adenosyltransferase [Pseudomonadota bacterium]|nr:methionine adenosyltransferase [Pseudomonadota bacterium]